MKKYIVLSVIISIILGTVITVQAAGKTAEVKTTATLAPTITKNDITVVTNNYPTMISSPAPSQNNWITQARYCSNLIEAGSNDWRMPTMDELSYAVSTLKDTTGNAVSESGGSLWTRTHRCDATLCSSGWLTLSVSDGSWGSTNASASVRCIR